jgi:ParB family transcriptional regulator, chromosome partitioning protein
LSALLPEQPNQNNDDLRELDVDLIEPNPEQPRTRFTEDALEELAQSIRENGIVQPIVVRRKGGRFEIVAGERRWRASQRAGLNKIPAVVREISDEKMLELALIENIQRQELNAVEEAKAYKKLIEQLGLTQEMVATRVGKDRAAVAAQLRLLKLPEDVQRLLEENKISAGHARALLMGETPDVQRRVARNILDMNLSVREAERTIKRINSGKTVNGTKAKTKTEVGDANVLAAESKLQRKFGTKVKISPSTDKLGGKIEIEYYSDDDLQRIYNILMAAINTTL